VNSYGEILSAFDDVTRDSGRYFFTQVQVDRFANRALTEICARARYKEVYELLDAVSGTLEYSIAGNGYRITRVEYDDEVLLHIGRNSLRHADRDWATRSGTPKYYYLDEMYDDDDNLTVGLWEAPGTAGTDNIRVWYEAMPNTAVGTLPLSKLAKLDVPNWAVGAILFYMLHLAYLADTKMQNVATSAIYKMLYEDIVERLVMRSNDSSPKRWVMGSPSSPTASVLNRLPERIVE